MKVFQKGFNYSQDGRGNRLILHLQGCNMRCPWCSNPEGIPAGGALMTDESRLREDVCPHGAIRERALNREICRNCADRPCLRMRGQRGVRLSCSEISVEELLRECVSGLPMYFDGGGVTLTGGEVSLQFEEAAELLEGLGKAGVHRAIETNGTHPRLAEWIPLVDQWIMDVKHYDDEKHKSVTGVSNRTILSNLETVSAVHRDMLVRVPLIPGFNDSQADAEGFARLFSGKLKGSGAKVEFLSYHEYGKAKWAQCGLSYPMPNARIAPGTVEMFESALARCHIPTIRT
ncbi:MAG: glycyl-radical enzyme activating protein [Clostridia bacterium]|nr:glycyl-radical enzyme activating protein [Clostridia bacterium]